MAKIDASFGPATVIGSERTNLPVFSDLKTTHANRSEVDIEGYFQVTPAFQGAATDPFNAGEWIPIEITYTGSFSYKKVKRGRKRYKQLKGGTIYQAETWYGDDNWIDMSGFAISLKEAQASTTAALYAFEQKLLAGSDTIIGSRYQDFIYGLGGNDNISGGDGNDALLGGDGDDIISGGAGVNVLYGGAGRDRFILSTGEGVDGIEDYESGVDIIDTSNIYGGIATRQDGADLKIFSSSDLLAVLRGTTTL
jgi:Ca2+-binding RTX toxin-like protein